MSITREVLIDLTGSIDQVVRKLNSALKLDAPLKTQTVSSPDGSWPIAEGRVGPYPLVLMDAAHLDARTSRGFGWILELHCRALPGEAHSSFEARCDEDARRVMKQIGKSLRARCFALSNLQSLLGEYP